jgi:hypothetical protein
MLTNGISFFVCIISIILFFVYGGIGSGLLSIGLFMGVGFGIGFLTGKIAGSWYPLSLIGTILAWPAMAWLIFSWTEVIG